MEKVAINIVGYDQCTGCFGCYDICPINAIDMKYDKKGFYKPNILENCIKCKKIYPVIENKNNNKYIKAYDS